VARRRKQTPWRDLVSLLWWAPLGAIPFALFFQITSGQPFKYFGMFYLVSLIFAGFAMFGSWLAQHFLVPPLVARWPDSPGLTWKMSLMHAAASLVFACIGAIVIHLWVIHGFLGSGRAVLTLITYFALFGALFIGIALAANFYQDAMARAGSERELQLARRIQQSFLLEQFPARKRLEVHATNLSSKQVSGDFYDVVPLGDDGLLLAIADVSGKGVPAALLSSMLQASLRTQAASGAGCASMMSRINTLVCDRGSTGQFATFFLAAVNERDMTLTFTNAGHNFPILFRAQGERKLLEKGGLVVGMMDGVFYEEECVPLAAGDRIVLYTDGVTEAAREDHEMFGEERLMTLVESLPRALSARDTVDHVLAGLREFLGETEAGDDITVMVLRVV
jgi:hypothetical protein